MGWALFPGSLNSYNGITPGLTNRWGIIVIHVRAGEAIYISGADATAGVQSVWLNSSDVNDFNSEAWGSGYNNEKAAYCKTDWLAIGMNNTQLYHKTLRVRLVEKRNLTSHLGELESFMNETSNNIFDFALCNLVKTGLEARLKPDGVADNKTDKTYNLYYYSVEAGKKYRIKSPLCFVFQNSLEWGTVSNNWMVSSPVYGACDSIFTAPEGATYCVISGRPSVPDSFGCFEISSNLAKTDQNVEKLYDENAEYHPQFTNLFNPDTCVPGSLYRGNVESHATRYVTDFIRVYKDRKYYINGFQLQYACIYDNEKKYIRTFDTNDLQYTQTGVFVPSSDGYIRLTMMNGLDFAISAEHFVSTVGYLYTEYGVIDYSYKSRKLSASDAVKAGGSVSKNLFDSEELTYGTVMRADYKFNEPYNIGQYSTGIMDVGDSDTLYIKMFNRLAGQGYCSQVFCMDENKNKLKQLAMASSRTFQIVRLEPNTRYVRVETISNLTYPKDEIKKNLFITTDKNAVFKYASHHNVVSVEDVSYDFFDSAITFEANYLKHAMDAYISEIQAGCYDAVIPINTDLHTEEADSYKMLAYMSESGAADMCLNLGDSVPTSYPTKAETIEFLKFVARYGWSRLSRCPLCILSGNHDNNSNSGKGIADWVLPREFYTYAGGRHENFAGTGKNYGYYDIESARIRVVMIDSTDLIEQDGTTKFEGYTTTGLQGEQFQWLIDNAFNFKNKLNPSEWNVITVSHDRLLSLNTSFADVIHAMMEGTSVSGIAVRDYGPDGLIFRFPYSADFTQQGPVGYICHVNGHYHVDTASIMQGIGKYDIDIPTDNVITQRAGYIDVNGDKQNYTGTAGTITEHVMDTLCIDFKRRRIVMKRLGVGSDREFDF